MNSRSDTPDKEAEHAPLILLDDEDSEIRAHWIAAQESDDVEERILELRLISQDTQTDDLRGAIDGAIEDCEVHLGELASESEPRDTRS